MIYITIQARTQSTRFPNKILQPLYNNLSVLEIMLMRLNILKRMRNDIKIIILTTTNENDIQIVNHLENNKIVDDIFRGDEENVFKRMHDFIKNYNLRDTDTIIDLTSDCPLIDHFIVSDMIGVFNKSNFDYLSNTITRSFPDGFDVQVYSANVFNALEYNVSNDQIFNEHTGWNIVHHFGNLNYNYNFKVGNFPIGKEYFLPELGLTLDEKDDLIVLQNIFNFFKTIDFGVFSIIDLYRNHPELFEANKEVKRKIPGVE